MEPATVAREPTGAFALGSQTSPVGGGKDGMMKGFVGDIESLTEDNTDYRRVVYTGRHLQLVLMCLQPGEEVGEEVHEGHDQFFRIEVGEGEVLIDGARN